MRPRFLAVFALLSLALLVAPPGLAAPVTGTFLDRAGPATLRVGTYNLGGFIDQDSGFERVGASGVRFSDANARVVAAVDADVWSFQELDRVGASGVADALNRAVPLGGDAGWSVGLVSNTVVASRFPILDFNRGVFGTPRRPAIATIDLPDAGFARDLHVVGLHLKAFNGPENEERRLASVDAVLRHVRDTMTASSRAALPSGTPIVALGDFNTVDGFDPVTRLAAGDVTDEARSGPDFAPDWDGTALTLAAAVANGRGTDRSTFRSGGFRPLLDHQVYTDSVLTLEQAFVLDTTTLTAAERAATGLKSQDVVFYPGTSSFDHLPVVADYRLADVSVPEPVAAVLLLPGLLLLCARRRGGGHVEPGQDASALQRTSRA